MRDLPSRTPPTIRDVAALARVSVATVSRVINDKDVIRAETAERVRQAIEELGFRPNRIGRSLKTARSRTLGVLIPSLSNPVFAATLDGIQDASREAGYPLVLTTTNYSSDREQEAVDSMLSQQVDGLLLTVSDADESSTLDGLDAEGIPYVLLYNQPCRPGRAAVTVDNVQAARDITDRLIAAGHQRIGMVLLPARASDRSLRRRQGFLEALAAAGLPPGPLVEGDYQQPDFADRLASAFADPAQAPTALFCSNDMIALATIGALRRIGRSVPEDVSVVGFDGIPVGEWTRPTLATVVQPTRQMGILATRHLLARLQGLAAPELVLLPHTLRDGESLRPLA